MLGLNHTGKIRSLNSKNKQHVATFVVVILIVTLALSTISPDIARADSTVGTGTASSCTSNALFNAFNNAGNITFNCGSNPVTIYLNTRIIVNPNGGGSSTTVDGGGLITIDGSMSSLGIFYVNPNSSFTMKNLTLADAKVVGLDGSGGSSTGSAGGDGDSVQGAALTSFGTSVNIINSTFTGNSITGGNGGNGTSANGGKNGQNGGNGGSVQGAAIYNDSGTLNISGSTFQNNNIIGGNGGNGGPNNYGTSGSTNGNGGNGGNAQGSAIYNNSGTVSISSSIFQSNVASGGKSGQGGGTLHSGICGIAGSGAGGAIFNSSGTLTITTTTFSSNSAAGGNGAVGGSTVAYDPGAGGNGGNAYGSAVVGESASSTLNIGNSTFNNNSTLGGQGGAGGNSNNNGGGVGGMGGTAFGGAIATLTNSSTFNLFNSTLTGNHSTGGNGGNGGNGNNINVINGTGGTGGNAYGGGISGGGNLAKVINVTFAANGAILGTGGLYGSGGYGGTIGANGTAAGGNANLAVGSSLTNTLLANPTAGGSCSGTFTDGGNNLEFPGNSCGFSIGNHDQLSDPRLGSLNNNGGPTQTIALQSGSAAIDNGNFSVCAAAPINNKDQRDQTRLIGTTCDIGAYEYNPNSSGSSQTYYLPFLANNYIPSGQTKGFTTYLALQNLANTPANINIQYYTNNGTSFPTPSGTCSTIASNGECTLGSPFANGVKGAGSITSDQPLNVIVAEATPFGGSAYAVNSGANQSLVAPFAINNASGGFITQLNIFNAGDTATTATVKFFDQFGNPVAQATQNLAIPAHTNQTLDQTATSGSNPSNLPSGFYGWAQVTGASGSKLVGQVLEQRPDISFVAVANAPSTSSTTTLFAPAIFNGAFNFVTGANIINPNASPVTVQVTYYRGSNGTAITSAPITIPANAVALVYNGNSGLPGGFYGSAKISSTGGGVVVVVNESGGFTTSGTAQSGTYAATASGSNNIGLPVMANGGLGYTTGATILNTSGNTVTGSIQYYTTGGQVQGPSQSFTIQPYASQLEYQGAASLPAGFYGVAKVTENGNSQDLIITTNAVSSGFFYTYTEPGQ